jgi:DNA-binding Lrp family transcriptional regulator
MSSFALDELDRKLIHALQVDGRAPLSRVAAVLGVSDQTITRRYRRLRSAGALRVIAQADPRAVGQVRWYVRIRCAPDAAMTVAQALAKRSDTSFVHLVSGGTEINCVIQARTSRDRDALLLEKLPRTPRVITVDAHCLLHLYYGGAGQHPGFFDTLDPDQIDALSPQTATVSERVDLDERDHILLQELAKDGRAGYATLAAATGWSDSTVKRRLEQLRRCGALFLDVDCDIRLLGHLAEARLWMSVPPAQQDTVGRALATHPEIAFAAATTGPSNLVAAVVCSDVYRLHDYVVGRLGTLPAIQHLETAPIIRTLKGAATIVGN